MSFPKWDTLISQKSVSAQIKVFGFNGKKEFSNAELAESLPLVVRWFESGKEIKSIEYNGEKATTARTTLDGSRLNLRGLRLAPFVGLDCRHREKEIGANT